MTRFLSRVLSLGWLMVVALLAAGAYLALPLSSTPRLILAAFLVLAGAWIARNMREMD
jgi:hypothetical protein